MPGRRLNVQCFLEGIRVPFLGCQINITTNQASTASINVVATKEIFGIRPKTHVHLFFWDEATSPSVPDGAWRLLWEGEVVGIGYSKSPVSRSAQLACKDLSNYWDYTLRGMLNIRSGLRIRTEKLYFYGNLDPMVKIPTGGSPVDNFVTWEMSKSRPIPDSIHAILAEFANKLPLYKKMNEAYKMDKQLVLRPDTNITDLLKAQTFDTLIRNIEGRSGSFVPIRDVLLSFCRLVYYNIVSVPSASYVGNNLNAFIMKPNLYGTVPPACNVILPDILTSVTYHRNFMAEPTRMLMHTATIAGIEESEMLQPAYIAPAKLGRDISNLAAAERQKKEYYDAKLYTGEEREKGILPVEINMSHPEYLALGAGSEVSQAKEIRSVAERVLEYRFQMARYSNRTLSAVTDLNPWLVCNFPCAIFDAGRSYIGVIANITHTISASGGGHTAIDCNLAYEIDPDEEDSPVLPRWFNEAYRPNKINDTYKALFGCQAMEGDRRNAEEVELGEDQGTSSAVKMSEPGGKQAKISDLALGLYNPYDRNAESRYRSAVESGAAYAFADGYRRRPIATIKDVARFYGLKNADAMNVAELQNTLESPSGASLDGWEGDTTAGLSNADYFVDSRKEVIRAYMDDPETGIRARKILDGR